MHIKRKIRQTISICLCIAMILSLAGCSGVKETLSENQDPYIKESEAPVIDGVEKQDAFVRLAIDELSVEKAQVFDIDVNELLVDCVTVEEITVLEAEVVSLNDEFVYLAYQNFVSYYEEDIDFEKFLKDVAIGGACVIVYVTLGAAGGPVGTFFGAVMCSEFTAATLAVGAAIDAAVSGYFAYQEGGDLSYIIGHMMNGVADGFKWAAMLAPVSGTDAGIKTLRAVNNLKKLPGFTQLPDKALNQVLKDFSKIAKQTAREAAGAGDDAIKALYREISHGLSEEITEDIFLSIIKNSSDIIRIIEKYNPFNKANELAGVLKGEFLKKADVSDSAARDYIKKFQNKSFKKLSDIPDDGLRAYIKQNLSEFVELFGSSLAKEFLDDCLAERLGENAFKAVKAVISKESNLCCRLIEEIGKESVDEFLKNADILTLLQARYGAGNVSKLIQSQRIYDSLVQSKEIDTADIVRIADGLLDGSIKAIDDITKINPSASANAYKAGEIICASLKNLGANKKAEAFFNDIAAARIEMWVDIGAFPGSALDDILTDGSSKYQIIERYGEKAYSELMRHADQTVAALSLQSKLNRSLADDIMRDALSGKGIADDVIEKIMSGVGISEWGLADEAVAEIGNQVANYYGAVDRSTYHNFVTEYSELRCATAKAYNETLDKLTTNGKYAGSVMPTDKTLIKARYGDIYMSTAGFPIFDDYAIARIEIPDLTGLHGGADDIARANRLYYGMAEKIPGYTWHHLEDGKTLILIPTDLHDAYRHDGGAMLLRNGVFGER